MPLWFSQGHFVKKRKKRKKRKKGDYNFEN